MEQVKQMGAARFPPSSAFLTGLERSLQKYKTSWMLALLAAGVGARIWNASGTFLSPDEALHFFIANKTSWKLTYQASLSLSHPPLLILLLHAWRSVGTPELMLRCPSIIAGTLFCWISFRWLAMVFTESVAWIGFVFLLFLPSSIDLSTEIRQYALLLAFSMASAHLLELALAKNSVFAMFFSVVCLWLAILAHYSAFLVAVALSVYAIFRMATYRPPLKIFAAWEAGQVIAIGLGYFLYVTQLSRLAQGYGAGSVTRGWMSNSYLARSYFTPGEINPLLFIFARTGGVFQYAFGQSAVGDLGLVLFVIGAVLIFRRSTWAFLNSRQAGFLLIFPFAVNCAAALARVYPYGGTRHSAFLLPFALAGVSVAVAFFLKSRIALGIFAAATIALLCNLFPSHRGNNVSRTDQSSVNMKAAMDFLQQQVASAEPLFADYQTSLMLDYYLCQGRPVAMNRSVPGFLSYECGGHKVIATDWNTDIFTAGSFREQWREMLSRFNLPADSKVWVTQIGPSTHLAEELAQSAEFHIAPHDFGHNLHFFDLRVGGHLPDRAVPAS